MQDGHNQFNFDNIWRNKNVEQTWWTGAKWESLQTHSTNHALVHVLPHAFMIHFIFPLYLNVASSFFRGGSIQVLEWSWFLLIYNMMYVEMLKIIWNKIWFVLQGGCDLRFQRISCFAFEESLKNDFKIFIVHDCPLEALLGNIWYNLPFPLECLWSLKNLKVHPMWSTFTTIWLVEAYGLVI